ncbi:MAG: hypothetical protein COV44_09730 [Deltaproteobacteria bacterium CG11_big_fil_rev_8_21_14_0_20_45_16]|nr:MAG: hypothetical protein COV44_09730 [Deltaproteobacteria bacterium CG11_big_fil_rev_8_21_14_0_20_45_16]
MFHPQRTLITGGANGLGKEIARSLQRAGSLVTILDRDGASLKRTAEELGVSGIVYDLSNLQDLAREFSKWDTTYGPFDTLINNAAVSNFGTAWEFELKALSELLNINLLAPILLSQAFIKCRSQDKVRSKILMISSVSAFQGFPYASSYGASKSALLNFSEALSEELNEENLKHISVSVVCPSYLDSKLFSGARPLLGTRILKIQALADEIVGHLQGQTFLLIRPRRLAGLICLKNLLPHRLQIFLSRLLGVQRGMKPMKPSKC